MPEPGPQFVDATALFEQGLALHQKGDPAAAELMYRQVLTVEPLHFDALHLLGVIAIQRGDFGRAVELIGVALANDPDNPLYADAYCNRGMALRKLGKHEEAIAAYTKAIALKPDHADAYFNRANARQDIGEAKAALRDLERASELTPGNADASYNRGVTYARLNAHAEALAAFDETLRLAPEHPYLAGLRLQQKLSFCDWGSVADDITSITDKIADNKRVSPPHAVLGICDDPAIQRKAAEIWTRDMFPANPVHGPFIKTAPHARIRVGYYSVNFRNHPVAHLMAPVLENHDKRKFEIFVFNYGPTGHHTLRDRIEKSVDHFVDLDAMEDGEIAYNARKLEIDIAVDLAGHSRDARTGIFAMRAAPVQVNYIGYPGTMGADYYDYIVADATLIPVHSRQHYTEKVIYLPDCFQVNEVVHPASERRFTRAALGLPQEGFVFCNFTSNDKILPAIFESWMRILKAVPKSTLLLVAENESVAINLRREAATHGVGPERLTFGGRLTAAEYIARYHAVDLFLDTQPYNTDVIVSGALWAGVPVVTLLGESYAARMSASRLKGVGLDELVTTRSQDFEDLAIALANTPARMKTLKDKLIQSRTSARLFDVRRYTANLEDAYTRIHTRAKAGFKPEHVFV